MKIKTILILIIISTTLSSCVYKKNGAEIYDVKSQDSYTIEQIQKYNIKYVVETRELFWADITSKNGTYVINVEKNGNKIQYVPLKKSFTEKLKIEPKYSFWDNNGRYIAIPLTLILIILSILLFIGKHQ